MTDRELLQQALEALQDIHPANMTPMAENVWKSVILLLRQRLAQPEPEPFCWMITGSNQVYRGAYAEYDARNEAKIVGGDCVAFPLFTAPQKGTL